MRDILFRAKSDGIWEYGGFVKRSDAFKYYIVTIDGYNCVVDPDTLGEYSGLDDIKGNKIFEGDIVKDEYGKLWIVKFDTMFFSVVCIHVEVVGNIFDNPELIGGIENENN